MTAPLQLRTFGDFLLERVHEDGTTETVYRAGKLLALLLHLTIRGESPQRRAELADLFWGDESPDRARASLRQAIASLHRLLGASALIVTRETVQLAPGAVVTDRERFTDAVQRRDVEAVMTLYRGSFLAMEPRVGAEFERWVDAERLRLRRGYLLVMEGAVSEAFQAGEVTRATELARAVRAAEPEAAEGVRLLVDALGAGGRRSDARRVIEAFADQIAQTEEALPTELAQRLDRLRETPGAGDADRPFDAAALGGLGAELVGRDAILAELIAAAEQARLGTPRFLGLVGVSGSGKSRVLDEFESRLRLRGARVVRVRFLPAMRTVPFAGLAEIVRAIAVLPGALGVSAPTAAALVEFLPELRREFPAAEIPVLGDADRPRRRQEALLDLLAAVTERRAISLLVDDAHHADKQTLAVIRAIPRVRETRLLFLFAAWTPILDGTDGVEVLELPPLSAASVRAMLERVARWTTARWEAPFVDLITETTRGLPQAILLLVGALRSEGALSVEGGEWSTPDPEHLLARASEGRSLVPDLGPLTDIGRLLLRLLSVSGRPVPDSALREIARQLSLAATDEACGIVLEGLEARGLIVSRGGLWAIAHESVAEALRVADGADERSEARRSAVGWWASQSNVDLPTLEHLILLCAEGEDLPSARAAVATVTRNVSWWRAHRLPATQLANRLALAAGRPEWERELLSGMGWVARQSRRALAWYAAAAATTTFLLVTTAVLLWPRLRVEVEPLGEVYLPQLLGTLQVQPRVAVYNGFGRRLRLEGTVRAEAEGVARLIGDTVIPLADGQAQFRRLALIDLSPEVGALRDDPLVQRIRFRGPGWVLGTSTVVHGMVAGMLEGIRVIEARLNGLPLDSTLRVRVPVGTPLRFEVTFAYTTAGSTANYVVGAGPTWLDPERSVIRIAGLPRPVIDAWQTVEFTAPPATRPGHEHLIVLFKAEDSVQHLFSATNWVVGLPVWGDGNDIVSTLTEAKIDTLRRTGAVSFDRYLTKGYDRPRAQSAMGGIEIKQVPDFDRPTYVPVPIQGTAIEIDFVARTP